MNFLMIDGRGKPDGAGFQQAAQALFPLAYMLKFKVVRPRLDVDFQGAAEGLTNFPLH